MARRRRSRRRSRGLRGVTPQQRKLGRCAKRCKGRRMRAFQACIKSCARK